MQSVVYHFAANFLPFQKTRGRLYLMILLVRGSTAAANDVGVVSGMPDIPTLALIKS